MTVKVNFYQAGQTVEVIAHEQETILEVARRAEIVVDSPCNGNGTCGKCKARLADGSQVLACRTSVTANMVVQFIERLDNDNIQIRQDGQEINVTIDRLIEKKYVAPTDYTEVYRKGELLERETGNTVDEMYGLVIDIGTTTLVVALIDLVTGKELATMGALNPQSRFAQDVLSRITYASDQQGLEEMHRLLLAELNRIIAEISEQTTIAANRMYEVVFSGNTCMLHLAVKQDPKPLGKYPYTSAILGNSSIKAADVGLDIAPSGHIFLPPIISAYVGADISSGVIAARLAEKKGITLFIDIGTNGEMILATNGKLVATSTAAGPAFEGMNIVYGMRAAPGAIEGFAIEANGNKSVKVIDNQPATGICGSGLIDIVAELVRHKIVNKGGRIQQTTEHDLQDSLVKQDGKTSFQVTSDVYLSQKDIRQVQLAKGAIRSGIEALLAHENRDAEEVDRVLIAGSFGYHLNPESLVEIGLLPATFRNKIEFIGNTSKTGGQAFLLSNQIRQQAAAIVSQVTVVELANLPNFDRLFVKCLEF